MIKRFALRLPRAGCILLIFLILEALGPARLQAQTAGFDVRVELENVEGALSFDESGVVIPLGERVVFKVLVINDGPNTAESVAVTSLIFHTEFLQARAVETDPTGVPCTVDTSRGDQARCDVPTLAAGDTLVFCVEMEGIAAGETGVGLGATTPVPDEDLNNNGFNVPVTVAPRPQRDLALEMKVGPVQAEEVSFDAFEPIGVSAQLATIEVRLRVSNVGMQEMQGQVIISWEDVDFNIFSLGFNELGEPEADDCSIAPGARFSIMVCDVLALAPGDQEVYSFNIQPQLTEVEQGTLVTTAAITDTNPEDENATNDTSMAEVIIIDGRTFQVINGMLGEREIIIELIDSNNQIWQLSGSEATPLIDVTAEETITAEDATTGSELAAVSINELDHGVYHAWLSDVGGTGLSFKIALDEMAGSDMPYITVVNDTDLNEIQVIWLDRNLNQIETPVDVPIGTSAQSTVPPGAAILRAGNVPRNRWGDYSAMTVDGTPVSGFWFFDDPAGGQASRKTAQAFDVLIFDAFGDRIMPDEVTDAESDTEVPAVFVLHANYPNPFNPATTLVFDLPEAARVRVEIIDVLGRVVMMLPPQPVEAGAGRTLDLDASALPSGTYLYRVTAAAATRTMIRTGRMMLIK